MSKRIAYWIFNYAPEWEAASKEVLALLTAGEAHYQPHLVAMNTKRRTLQLRGSRKHIPLPWGLVGLPALRAYAGRFDINHVFASAAERLVLPRLNGASTVLTVTKECGSLAKLERNLPALRELATIVVESERHREILVQAGIAEDRLKLIYPGVDEAEYRPATEPFSILFATSPPVKHDLLSRGVHLMLAVAKRMPEIRLVLVWRERNLADLQRLIAQFGVTNVEVRNGRIDDMGALYDSVHATILPGLTHNSLKPCPHTTLESIAHGKPVLVSEPTSLSGLVGRHRCGVVFAPTVDGLGAAIRELAASYEDYREACRPTVAAEFSREVFLRKYLDIYASLPTTAGVS